MSSLPALLIRLAARLRLAPARGPASARCLLAGRGRGGSAFWSRPSADHSGADQVDPPLDRAGYSSQRCCRHRLRLPLLALWSGGGHAGPLLHRSRLPYPWGFHREEAALGAGGGATSRSRVVLTLVVSVTSVRCTTHSAWP